MQNKDFIYFLFDENNNSYYQYGDTVLLSASLKPLEFTPDGWTKIQVQNQRNSTYFALDRSFTVPLEYVKDGAQILKHIYYNFGVEAKVYMSICEQRLYFDATHYGYYYTLLYRGEIDLANFKHDSTKVTVNIMEGGVVKLIKAFENTKYEIPVDVPEAVNIYMDGLDFKYNLSFLTLEDSYFLQRSVASSRQWLATFYKISTEGANLNIITNDIIAETDNSIDYATDERFFLKALVPIDLTANFVFKGFLTKSFGNSNIDYLLKIVNQNGTIVHTIINENRSGFPAVNEAININQSVTLNLNAGDKLFLILSISVNSTDGSQSGSIELTETTSTFNYFSKYKESTIKGLRPLYVFQQLISKITDGAYIPQSTFLQSIQDVVITCGDAIRNLPGSVIKTSLRDFFASYNSDFGIGMGMLGSILRLEDKAYWVQYTDFIDLGEVSKMKVSPATDLIVNNIKIGTPNQDYDDVNGKEEFNTTHEYSTPITRISKELNLISVYRKDCYGIEFTRLNLDGKTTTDNESDNDVFMIHIEDNPQGDGLYHLDRSLNANTIGLLTPATVFNLFLTPARAIRRNGNYIRSLFFRLDAKYLKFQTTDKNAAVVAGGITENADIQIASLDAPLFSCNYLEFETKVPVNLLDLLKANPLKAFAGTWAGFPFVGIPDKVSVQPGDNGSQTYKLLASPTTDLTLLTTIDG